MLAHTDRKHQTAQQLQMPIHPFIHHHHHHHPSVSTRNIQLNNTGKTLLYLSFWRVNAAIFKNSGLPQFHQMLFNKFLASVHPVVEEICTAQCIPVPTAWRGMFSPCEFVRVCMIKCGPGDTYCTRTTTEVVWSPLPCPLHACGQILSTQKLDNRAKCSHGTVQVCSCGPSEGGRLAGVAPPPTSHPWPKFILIMDHGIPVSIMPAESKTTGKTRDHLTMGSHQL